MSVSYRRTPMPFLSALYVFWATPSQNNNGSSSKLRGSRRFGTYFTKTMAKRFTGGEKMKTLRSGARSLALALLFAIGAISICAAKTFVYVSNAQDGNIDAYTMDTSTGALTPIGNADDSEPEQKAPLRRGPLAATARIDLRYRFRNRRAHAGSLGAASRQHALCL